MAQFNAWSVREDKFTADKLHHSETVFTIGNGYLSSRGVFEEGCPGEMRSTFIHGVFDDVPVVFTELANAPDWMELEILLAGERFSMAQGEILSFERSVDLQTATLRREVLWRSPKGRASRLVFERFASLDDVHLACVRVQITAEDYSGPVEIRAGINAEADNLGVKHWTCRAQSVRKQQAWLLCQTRSSAVDLAMGIHLDLRGGGDRAIYRAWDVSGHPTVTARASVQPGETVTAQKWTSLYTSRDGKNPLALLQREMKKTAALSWDAAWERHCQAWRCEWERCDVEIDGDEEAQLAVRFNLFQLLIAAPKNDEHVNIGAKTLSGYGYRGHSFWDTEIFMLPFFTYTRPEIARGLLSYRFHNLPGARAKARANGFEGAQYPWESAGTGEEVTPTWVPDPADRTKLIRIWTGDIEVHISADIAFAIMQYWRASGDDEFLLKRGTEVILDIAEFWSSRVEWNAACQRFEINDIIGPDEYHDHVDNNVYTNALIRWHLQTALSLAQWIKGQSPAVWKRLSRSLGLTASKLERWQYIIDHLYIPYCPETKLYEQFEGYFQRKDIDLRSLEPRTQSAQQLFGIEGVAETQIIKQPDVLMLFYLLPELADESTLRANYEYYSPRTDHTFGSSLGPSIQAIMACRYGDPDAAYDHFMRAARADLFDVRGNAGDGIHGASAGGLWQAVVFGFAGLRQSESGWQVNPCLPPGWKRVAFKIVHHGQALSFEVKA